MKQKLASVFRDIRVIGVSVLASGLLLGGTVVGTQNVAFQPNRGAAAPGQVLKGEYSLGGATDGNAVANDDIKLPRALRYPIAGNRAEIVRPGGPYTANCPGVGQVVPRGYLCVYERHHEGAAVYLTVWNPATGQQGIDKKRMIIHGYSQTVSYGSWALRAGDASTARSTSGARTSLR